MRVEYIMLINIVILFILFVVEKRKEGYCWGMDEWKCKNNKCGYGGDGQPSNCNDISGEKINVLSCGYQEESGFWKTKSRMF